MLCLWACLFAVICDSLMLLVLLVVYCYFIAVGAYWLDGVLLLFLTLTIGEIGFVCIGWNVVWVLVFGCCLGSCPLFGWFGWVDLVDLLWCCFGCFLVCVVWCG